MVKRIHLWIIYTNTSYYLLNRALLYREYERDRQEAEMFNVFDRCPRIRVSSVLHSSLSLSLSPLPLSLSTLSPLPDTSISIYTFETTIGACRCHRLEDTFISVRRICIFIFCHRLLANSPYFRSLLWQYYKLQLDF